MNENMEFPGATGEYIEWLQDSFAKTIKEVVEKDKNDPFVKREERGKVIHSFVAFCSFFPCSLTVFHRGRQQKKWE